MPELDFKIEGADAVTFAAAPTLALKLRVSEVMPEDRAPTPIHAVVLRCQIRIEPTRRTYDAAEKERLRDLFGEPSRWGQTLRSMLWTHVSVMVPGFEGDALVDMQIPCTFDFNVAATKYFGGVESGDIPLCLLFSGTIFYDTHDSGLQVTQISWEKEANFRLPVAVWKRMMDEYYPNSAWLCLRRDTFERLLQFRTRGGQPTWDQAIESLLSAKDEVAP